MELLVIHIIDRIIIWEQFNPSCRWNNYWTQSSYLTVYWFSDNLITLFKNFIPILCSTMFHLWMRSDCWIAEQWCQNKHFWYLILMCSYIRDSWYTEDTNLHKLTSLNMVISTWHAIKDKTSNICKNIFFI